jgi:hypothetical protein
VPFITTLKELVKMARSTAVRGVNKETEEAEIESAMVSQADLEMEQSISADDGDAFSGGNPVPDGRKTPKKTDDEKRADFSRLMSGRMSRVMDALTQIMRLSNTQSYDWEPEQIAKAARAIRERLDAIEASFHSAKVPVEGKRKASRQLSYIA